MYLMNEELARAQQHERLEAAQTHMLVRQAKTARKAARKAERAAQQARLAIARQL